MCVARPGSVRNKSSDLLVFESRYGGASLRIQTECPNHMCIVMFDGSKHLHSNVHGTDTLTNNEFIRIVPYCKKGIDEYTNCVAAGMPSGGNGGPEHACAGQNWVPPQRSIKPAGGPEW